LWVPHFKTGFSKNAIFPHFTLPILNSLSVPPAHPSSLSSDVTSSRKPSLSSSPLVVKVSVPCVPVSACTSLPGTRSTDHYNLCSLCL
jgi:hypothetical protein